MSRGRRATPALIGAFVLGAVALAAAVVVIWGSGRFFRQTRSFVCYFTGSVNGLNPGAPVKFRGVPIGSVTDIRFRLAEARAPTPDEFRIPVWFDVDLKQLSELRGRAVRLDRARLDELIAQGLRAQLQTESFVTGVLYVGLDFFPGSPIALVHGERADILEVPTMPTALERASQTISKLAARIEQLDIEGLVRSITEAFDGANALVRSPVPRGRSRSSSPRRSSISATRRGASATSRAISSANRMRSSPGGPDHEHWCHPSARHARPRHSLEFLPARAELRSHQILRADGHGPDIQRCIGIAHDRARPDRYAWLSPAAHARDADRQRGDPVCGFRSLGRAVTDAVRTRARPGPFSAPRRRPHRSVPMVPGHSAGCRRAR